MNLFSLSLVFLYGRPKGVLVPLSYASHVLPIIIVVGFEYAILA